MNISAICCHGVDLERFLFKFIPIADDTNVFFAGKNIEMLSKTMNTEIDKVSNWLIYIANKLTINIKKTEFSNF